MLSFDPKAWDLFFVYKNDFVAEVDRLTREGVGEMSVSLRPFDGKDVKTKDWSDFC